MMDLRYPISFAMGDKPNDFVFLLECVFAAIPIRLLSLFLSVIARRTLSDVPHSLLPSLLYSNSVSRYMKGVPFKNHQKYRAGRENVYSFLLFLLTKV